jgi:signal transduction histidine kinase
VIRSALVTGAAGAVAAGLIWPVYGSHAALVTAALVAGVSAIGLTLAHRLARRPSRRALRRRFDLVAATAIGVIIVTVLATAELMFVSSHDALIVSAIALAAGIVAIRAAQVASDRLVAEVGSIRDGLRSVGRGERSPDLRAGAAAELAELAEAANLMTEQLTEEEARRDAADSARRNLVAAVSHDLRTPMTALRLMLDAIDDELVDDDARDRYLATMRTHVTALGALIDDLFELSRLEAGDLEWSVEQVELADLLNEAVAAMRVEADAKGVAVAAELPRLPRSARGDPQKLQRVLFNLIQNAIRHTPADGSVTVRAEPAGDWVEVEVADTGAGIEPGDRERVFDAFTRGDESRAGGGAGLGLAISRAIVEAHGGRIWLADSEVGTCVRFVIPT